MKILYFDTIAGISGDMTLGAMVNAGMPLEKLSSELSRLNLSGFELAARHVERSGIVGVKIDVVVTEQPKYHRHLADINAIIDKYVDYIVGGGIRIVSEDKRAEELISQWTRDNSFQNISGFISLKFAKNHYHEPGNVTDST